MEKQKNLTREVISNSFWDTLFKVINRLGSLICTLVIVHFLIPSEYGIYNLALSIAAIIITFADLGVNTTLIRYLSYSLGNKKRAVSAYFRYLMKIKLYLTSIFSILVMVLAYPLSFYIFNKPLLFYPLIISGFYIFITSFEGFLYSVFYAFKNIKYLSKRETAVQIIELVLLLIAFISLSHNYYISGVIISTALSYLIIIFVNFYYIKKLSPSIFKKEEYKIGKSKILRYLLFTSITTISAVFFGYIDTIMIGIFVKDASYIGYYRLAFALVFGVGSLMSFTNIFLPIFTQIEHKRIQDAFDRTIKYLMIIAIPAAVGLAILGKYFIRLLFGYNYLPAALPLYFLSFLVIETALSGLLVSLFQAKEKPEKITHFLIIATVINIILNFILIKSLVNISPLWAIAGAAIATLISRFFYSISLVVSSRKEFNLKFKFSLILRPVISSLIMALAVYLIKMQFNSITLLNGIALVLIGIIIYFVSLFLIGGIKKEDIYLIKNLFSRR